MFLRKLIIIGFFFTFSFAVIGYGLYKAMPIILGPEILVASPKNGDIVQGTSIEVRGTVSRSKALFINNIPTPFTEDGNFFTRLPIYPGSNIIILSVRDRFGREISKTINIGTN